MRLILASNNAKKLAELELLFAPLALVLLPQAALDVAEADEPYQTFIENALAKARHAAQHAGAAAIADDSGLCVDALGGAPGVDSAHYANVRLPSVPREAQRSAQDDANNGLLLQRLAGCGSRSARFVSTLVALRAADDPEPLVAFGRWEGVILDAPSGSRGFGYDPLLFIPSLGHSVAELEPAVKNAHSHRALAAQQMLTLMREVWHVG